MILIHTGGLEAGERWHWGSREVPMASLGADGSATAYSFDFVFEQEG